MPPLASYPLSYALHIAEEAWVGESFPVWASRFSGVSFTHDEFVVLNGVALALMCVAVSVARAWPQVRRLVVPALGTIVTVNGALHLAASLWSVTYSPGVISGTLVWLPLGVWTLWWAARALIARQLLVGCVVGALAHAAVSAVAFFH